MARFHGQCKISEINAEGKQKSTHKKQLTPPPPPQCINVLCSKMKSHYIVMRESNHNLCIPIDCVFGERNKKNAFSGFGIRAAQISAAAN